jgi:MYXO-CTERM domain-containing protein
VEKQPLPLKLQVLETLTIIVRVDSEEPIDVSEAMEVPGAKVQDSDSLQEQKGVRIQGGLRVDFPKTEPPGIAVKHWQKVYQVTPLRAGTHLLKLPKLQYLEGEDSIEVVWKPLEIEVRTRVAKADISEVRDLTAVEEVPPPAAVPEEPPLWPWLLGLVPVVGLGAVWLLRRRTRRIKEPSPREVVLRHLDELRQQPTDDTAQVQRWHTRLSDLLRWYLEKQLHLPATRQTTPEFFLALERSGKLRPEQQAPLNEVLAQCDLAKFAQVVPAREDCLRLVEAARQFVEGQLSPVV